MYSLLGVQVWLVVMSALTRIVAAIAGTSHTPRAKARHAAKSAFRFIARILPSWSGTPPGPSSAEGHGLRANRSLSSDQATGRALTRREVCVKRPLRSKGASRSGAGAHLHRG